MIYITPKCASAHLTIHHNVYFRWDKMYILSDIKFYPILTVDLSLFPLKPLNIKTFPSLERYKLHIMIYYILL